MISLIRRFMALAALAAGLPACVGTTGSDLVTFDAAAAGPADAVAGQPFTFTSERGFQVTLTTATLHIGAVYLSRGRSTSGSQATDCILPGSYVAEVTEGLEVNLLSPEPQPFPGKGEGTADPAISGQVWLTDGDVNAPDDDHVIFEVDGTAERGGASYPFEGKITIGANRAKPVTDPSMPGANPICKQRIVSPIDLTITPRNGGSLLVRVDPRVFFANVDFSALDLAPDDPHLYAFGDDQKPGPDANLFSNGIQKSNAYDFSWQNTMNP